MGAVLVHNGPIVANHDFKVYGKHGRNVIPTLMPAGF
jgi:hypothetical protein